jgi:anti-sigma factor RsiW
MKCKTATQWLYLYASGELSGRRCSRLEKHLNACSACRQALADYQQVAETYQTASHVPESRLTAEQIMKSVGQVRQVRPVRVAQATYFPRMRFVVAAALVLIVIGVSLGVFQQRRAARTSMQTEVVHVDVFQPATFALDSRVSGTTALQVNFRQPPERLDSLARDVVKLRWSGNLHSGRIQQTELMKKHIKELRADDWLS